jgi:hypothetical protein
MCRRRGTPRRRCSSKASTWPSGSGPRSPRSRPRPRLCARGTGAAPGRMRRWSGRGRGRHGGGALAGPLPVGGPDGRATSATSSTAHRPRRLRHLSARLHPRRAVAALVAALTRRGGGDRQYRPDAMRSSMPRRCGPPGVERARGRQDHRRGREGAGRRADATSADLPQLYAEGLHIVPHADGTVAVGSTSEREWDDPTATDTQLDAVIARARAACPALRDAPVIERWAGIRPRARSRAPILGPTRCGPGNSSPMAASRSASAWRRLVATLMADLVVEASTASRPSFAPRRACPKAPRPCAGRPSAPPARRDCARW